MRVSVVVLLAGYLFGCSDAVIGPVRVQTGLIRRYLCPPAFVRLGNGCYYFSSHISTWQGAHFSCKDRNSSLLALDSKWEDKTLRSYLERPEFARLERWIGGLFDWSLQRWVWGAQGTPISHLNFGEQTPSNAKNWHCIFMDPTQGHRWNHKLCVKRLHYVCETALTKFIATPRPVSEDSTASATS